MLGLLFFPLDEVLNMRPINLPQKKKLAWRSCFMIFLLLFYNSQCGNIRLSLESILLQDVWEPQVPSEAKLQ